MPPLILSQTGKLYPEMYNWHTVANRAGLSFVRTGFTATQRARASDERS